MVRRFLTKEQTYAQYLEAVANAEKEIENLKIENEKLQLNYQDIDLENDGGSKKEMYEEIDRLTNSINIVCQMQYIYIYIFIIYKIFIDYEGETQYRRKVHGNKDSSTSDLDLGCQINPQTQANSNTHTYIYIYIYI